MLEEAMVSKYLLVFNTVSHPATIALTQILRLSK